MILSMPGQAWLFLATVGVGAGVGVFYDAFRVLRRVVAHRRWVVHFEDGFFWLCATVLVFYYMLHRSGGEIRFFAVVGMVVGAVLYFATVSRFVVRAAVALVNYLLRVAAAVVRVIVLPVRLLLAFAAPPAKAVARKLRRRLRPAARYGKMKLRKAAHTRRILRKKV